MRRLTSTSKLKMALGVGLCVLGTFACTFLPYDGQVIKTRTEKVQVTGAWTEPNKFVHIQMCTKPIFKGSRPAHCDSSFGSVGNATTSSTVSYTDNNGAKWYKYEAKVPVRWFLTASYSGGGQPVVDVYTAHLRAVLADGSIPSFYRNPTDECEEEFGSDQLTGSAPCAVSPGSERGWIEIVNYQTLE